MFYDDGKYIKFMRKENKGSKMDKDNMSEIQGQSIQA